MLNDVMVHLDGTQADARRVEAANDVAACFDSHLVGLFLNPLPDIVPADGVSTVVVADLIEAARRAGDTTEAELIARLRRLGRPVEIRRFDAVPDTSPRVAAREARSADVFIDLRPAGSANDADLDRTVESVLFGSGRHLLLIPGEPRLRDGFRHALVAWNGSREATRGLAEALPYLHRSQAVTVVVVREGDAAEENALIGSDAVKHLRHHGVHAHLSHAKAAGGDVGPALVQEAGRLQADLMVMGGYGHSRVREWLLGGVSRYLLHHAPVPLVIAH